ncbi:MAG: Arc family DNA-binding protein [Anaerolineae bacterium]|nr:Arc family DNA-binding protein [Anaerolineae bacterium]MCB0179080.1 Arc family DNA-binding protein [Anaerolineae bacterium]MCB9105276.1 Arc family DNA-binding protein [Anaerolineales bacterium]
MSVMSLRLPKTMYDQLKRMAEAEGISMNHFVTLAIAEKIATLNTLDYLEERAQRGSREKLLAVLAKAPDVEPEEYDKL